MASFFKNIMKERNLGVLVSLILLLALCIGIFYKEYSKPYTNLIEAARKEGKVVVYSSTSEDEVSGLIQAFRDTYPFIQVDYQEHDTTGVYSRIVQESDAGVPTGDIAWSSATNLQIKLVNDQYAQEYVSPEKSNLPSWAIWKNEAWGLTAEPVVIVYNQAIVPSGDVPQTHEELITLLRDKTTFYDGRVATYDPETSGAGYLLLNQDFQINHDFWNLVRAFGATHTRLYSSSRAMLADVESGKVAIAYNVLGSYALSAATQNPSIGIVMPTDYTLVTSRIALITRDARHPNAARLLLDFMLSRRGQAELARVHMTTAGNDAFAMRRTKSARPVQVSPALLASLDSINRRQFLERWNEAYRGQ